jgi:thiamine kinase-like enzyme
MDSDKFMERIAGDTIIGIEKEIFSQIIDFLRKNGIIPVNNIRQIEHGRNSQIYLIDQGKYKWIVKKYHRHAYDSRKRLENEFGFLSFLKNNEVIQIAEPIASDSEKNMGLFSHLPGELPKAINGNLVNQACDFIKKINESRNKKSAKHLPEASEACFSIISHINCVKKRVTRLNKTLSDSSLQYDVSFFVQSSLVTSLEEITNDITKQYSDEKLKQSLPLESRIISPSDFGFQNTLIESNTLLFLDFEYAGWDDPAKLICDFGCHPEIPIKDEYLQVFKNSFLTWLEDAEDSIYRSEILMPLYRLKWCCIMLNEFTSEGRDRRNHAGKMIDQEKQFKKVKTYFEQYLA